MPKTVQVPAHVYAQLTSSSPKPRTKKRQRRKTTTGCKKGFIFKCKTFVNNLIGGIVLFLMILGAFWIGEVFTPFNTLIYPWLLG